MTSPETTPSSPSDRPDEQGEPRPALVAVDDDPDILRALDRDLRRIYADRYRVLTASSGEEALDGIHRMRLRGEPLAIALAGHQLPGMSGLDLLGRLRQLVPDARTVPTVTYLETDLAIRAIDAERIHHDVLEPWDPPEQRLPRSSTTSWPTGPASASPPPAASG